MQIVTSSLERILALDDGHGRTVADLLAAVLVGQALNGDLRAARLVLDHCEGRPEPKSPKSAFEKAESERIMAERIAQLSVEDLRALARMASRPDGQLEIPIWNIKRGEGEILRFQIGTSNTAGAVSPPREAAFDVANCNFKAERSEILRRQIGASSSWGGRR